MIPRWWPLVVIVALATGGCDEVLPDFRDPSVLFTGTLAGDYALSLEDSAAVFYLALTNTYDETFEDTAVVSGTIVVRLIRDPSYTRTLSLSNANIWIAPAYSSSSGILRVGPGERVTLKARWDFLDDNDRWLPGSAFRLRQDPLCPVRLVADAESFSVQADVRLFRRDRRTVSASALFTFCYALNFVPATACPPINTPTAGCR